ncbi:MAG: hypothetical protein NXI35_12535 [bacterium]|nr:hypothetical protein [bacterium]
MFKTILLLATALVATPSGERPDTTDATATRSVEFLGLRFCAGPSAQEDCDVHVFSDAQTQPSANASGERAPVMFSVMGTKLCLGDVPTPAACDVRLGGTA